MSLTLQLAERTDDDPQAIEDMRQDTADAVDAANRWTDAIAQVRSTCERQFGMEPAAFASAFLGGRVQ